MLCYDDSQWEDYRRLLVKAAISWANGDLSFEAVQHVFQYKALPPGMTRHAIFPYHDKHHG